MARSRLPARLLAVAALAVGAVVLVSILGSEPASDPQQGDAVIEQGQGQGQQGDRGPARYVVQSGDTLIDIAEKTGVSLSRLEELNPGMDPQRLMSGQTLRLR